VRIKVNLWLKRVWSPWATVKSVRTSGLSGLGRRLIETVEIKRLHSGKKTNSFDGGQQALASARFVVLHRGCSLVEIHFHVTDSLHAPQRSVDSIAAGIALASE